MIYFLAGLLGIAFAIIDILVSELIERDAKNNFRKIHTKHVYFGNTPESAIGQLIRKEFPDKVPHFIGSDESLGIYVCKNQEQLGIKIERNEHPHYPLEWQQNPQNYHFHQKFREEIVESTSTSNPCADGFDE